MWTNPSSKTIDVLVTEDIVVGHPLGMTKAKIGQGTAVVELMASILRTNFVGILASPTTKVVDPSLMLNSVDVEAIGFGGFVNVDEHGIRHSGEGSDEKNATEERHGEK